MYRQIGLDMTRRLGLEARYQSTGSGAQPNERDRRLIALAHWGVFLLES